MPTERSIQSILLTNTSEQTVMVESEVVVWPHDAPKQLASDVVVTPAVLTLPPGQRMRVRVGLLRVGDPATERAYRLYFTELPAPGPMQEAGVGVRLRVGIPLFVAPASVRSEPLQWRARSVGAGWQLQVHNPGNVHARLANTALRDGAQRFDLDLPSPYVLAGTTVSVDLPHGLQPGSGTRAQWLEGDDAREASVAVP